MDHNQHLTQSSSSATTLIKNARAIEGGTRQSLKIVLRYGRQHREKVEMLLMLPPKFKEAHIKIAQKGGSPKFSSGPEEEGVNLEVRWSTRPAFDVMNRMAQALQEYRADEGKVLLTTNEVDYIVDWKGTTMEGMDKWCLTYAKLLREASNSTEYRTTMNTWLQIILLIPMAIISTAAEYTVELYGGPFAILKSTVSKRGKCGEGNSIRLFRALLSVFRDIDNANARCAARGKGSSIQWDRTTATMESEQELVLIDTNTVRALGKQLYTKMNHILRHRSVSDSTQDSKIQELHSADDPDLKEVLGEIRKLIQRST